jgi:hypothetical protein
MPGLPTTISPTSKNSRGAAFCPRQRTIRAEDQSLYDKHDVDDIYPQTRGKLNTEAGTHTSHEMKRQQKKSLGLFVVFLAVEIDVSSTPSALYRGVCREAAAIIFDSRLLRRHHGPGRPEGHLHAGQPAQADSASRTCPSTTSTPEEDGNPKTAKRGALCWPPIPAGLASPLRRTGECWAAPARHTTGYGSHFSRVDTSPPTGIGNEVGLEPKRGQKVRAPGETDGTSSPSGRHPGTRANPSHAANPSERRSAVSTGPGGNSA